MSGIHATSGVPYAWAGLRDAIRAALGSEPVDFTTGFDPPAEYPDFVVLGAAEAVADPKDVGPRRSRDETIQIDVGIGSWRSGHTEDVADAARTRAYELLSLIEAYVTTGDHITLGGAVLWCLPGNVTYVGDEYENGFQVELAVTFIASHRVRGV